MKKLLPLFLFLCLGAAYSAETVDGVRREIQSVNAEIAREKKLHADEKTRHEDFVRSGRDKVVSLNNQKKALGAEIDSMKAELNRLNEARNKSVGVAHWYDSRKQKYAQDLALTIEGLVPYFEADFPYRTSETVESLRETATELRKGVIAPDDALGRVMEIFLDRLRMGYTTESWDGFLTDSASGKSLSGTYFRFGAVAAMFESSDAADLYWLDNSQGAYRFRKVPEDLTVRAQMKEAFKVAGGKAAPHIVRIPVPAKGSKMADKADKEAK